MNKSVAASVFAFVALLAWAGYSHAGINSYGAVLRGGSGTDWSSDLGLDYHWPLHLDDPADGASDTIGPGSTNPFKPWNYYFNGESVDSTSYYSSPSYLSSALHVAIAAGGDVEGKVSHIHIDNTVPPVGGYGLGSHSSVNATFAFDGGTPGSPTTVYYAFAWLITTDIPAVPGASMEYLIDVGSNGTGRVQGGGTPQNLSGSRFGSFILGNGGGGTSFNGSGVDTSQFSFAAFNGSGSSNPGGHSTYDVWFAFSAAPITTLPVPEPATYALMLAGLGLVAGVARRKVH